VTCADAEATHRTIVHGTYVDKNPFNKATSEMKNAFEKKYNQMNNL
jgi:sortase A